MRVMRNRLIKGLHLGLLRSVALAIALLLAPAAQPAAEADWRSGLNSAAERLGMKPAPPAPLEAAVSALKTFALTAKGPVLAAAVSQEGHWTFANKLGEKFTAASPDELSRAVSTLAPDAAANAAGSGPGPATGAAAPLTLLLTEDTVFDQRAKLKDLPKNADLRLVVNDSVLRLHRRGTPSQTEPGPSFFAEIRPNLLVAVLNRGQFDEAVWQLNRPLKNAHIRVLALEPGGPPTLTSAPKLDPASRRPLIDRLDPLRAADGIKALRGQTAIIVGRADGKLLFVRGSSGPEQSVILSDLVQAAEAADVNLVLLQSASARQPGAKNWLWQSAEVAGLDSALSRAQLSDLLTVLGSGERPLVITPPLAAPPSRAEPSRAGRVTLTAATDVPPSVLESLLPVGRATEAVAGAIDDMMSGLTGKVAVTAVRLHLQSRDRATELAGRRLPSVPAGWIEVYVGALLLGLLNWRRTSQWWQRLWPQEARSDYPNVFGFRAAQAARLLLMTLFYLPLAGVLALPTLLWRWLKPGRAATSAPAHSGASQ